jgi:hypothetical protein
MVRRNPEQGYVPAKSSDRPGWRQVLDIEFGQAENRRANLSLLAGIGLFAGSIVFLRSFGDLIVPVL